MAVSTVVSIVSMIIALFSLFIVLLNRNDKFRPYIYVYYSSIRSSDMNTAEGIYVKNFSDVPGFISKADLKYKKEVFVFGPAIEFLPIDDDGTVEKRRYVNLRNSLKRACENRTFLPGEKVIIPLDYAIVTPDKNTFEELPLSELREKYSCKDFESTEDNLFIKIEYQKTFNSLGFFIPRIDKFKEKILILKRKKAS